MSYNDIPKGRRVNADNPWKPEEKPEGTEVCPQCHGVGSGKIDVHPDYPPQEKRCPTCGGDGWVCNDHEWETELEQTAPSLPPGHPYGASPPQYRQSRQHCTKCGATRGGRLR